jgi:hypothetical protein
LRGYLADLIVLSMSNAANHEYIRKLIVAASIAAGAWVREGLDGMQTELASLRRMDADPVVIAEVERIYHMQCLRVLPEERLA